MQVREQRLVVTYQRPSSVTSFRVGPQTESDHPPPHPHVPTYTVLGMSLTWGRAEHPAVTQPIGVNYKVACKGVTCVVREMVRA